MRFFVMISRPARSIIIQKNKESYSYFSCRIGKYFRWTLICHLHYKARQTCRVFTQKSVQLLPKRGMTMQRILLIEDEASIARFIELELKHEGFAVTVCADGREGLQLAQSTHFDILLVDVMLPGLNGIEICRRIRKASDVPIILVTARDAVMDRVGGLDAGADDYIVKPFAIEELLARIRTILRRTQPKDVLVIEGITIDRTAHSVSAQGQVIELTKTEYDLLLFLAMHHSQVCTREQILTAVWGFDTEVETNVVDVYIRHLRTKLGVFATIETVRGVGYVMRQ